MKPQHPLPDPNEPLFDTPCRQEGLSELTSREWAVLLCLTDDMTNTEMADQLCLTAKAVTNYRTRIGHKLGLIGVHKLARFARKRAVELHSYYERQYRPRHRQD